MTGWGSEEMAYEMETPEKENDIVEFLLEAGFVEVKNRELPYIDHHELIEYRNEDEDVEKLWRFFARPKKWKKKNITVGIAIAN